MAYAGRLDPMASGKLLVLIGDECKRQTLYHDLDKGYLFSVLFGVSSDTADPLGRLQFDAAPTLNYSDVQRVVRSISRTITLPYPHFSAKTVKGKPLHTWTLEGRLDEIDIPKKRSTVYSLSCSKLEYISTEEIVQIATSKITTVSPVTDPRKKLGNDFRRTDVLADWNRFAATHQNEQYPIATFSCTASSGTYMRSLAEYIAKQCDSRGLAWSIHRTHIGKYAVLTRKLGFWYSTY